MTPTRPHVQEMDDAIAGQTGSAEPEYGTEMQDHETLEQLCSTLDAILMGNNADEADSNSDDDAASDKGTDIDPDLDDLTFVKLARLRPKE